MYLLLAKGIPVPRETRAIRAARKESLEAAHFVDGQMFKSKVCESSIHIGSW